MLRMNFDGVKRKEKEKINHHWPQSIENQLIGAAYRGRGHCEESNDKAKEDFSLPKDANMPPNTSWCLLALTLHVSTKFVFFIVKY